MERLVPGRIRSEPFSFSVRAIRKSRRVVHRQTDGLASSLDRRANVRLQDRLWRHLSIVEESVRGFQLRLVEYLRKALGRPSCHPLRKTHDPPGETAIPERRP